MAQAQPPLSQTEVEARVLPRLQSGELQHVIKVLLLGNSGTGKSFCLNCLLGCDMFGHSYQPDSCTAENSFATYDVGTTVYVLCNVPGLLEADQSNIERNKRCIESAFEMLPQALTVVAFVIDSGVSGRLKADHVEAYKSVTRYVPDLQAASTTVLVNGVRRFKEQRDEIAFRMQTSSMVKEFMEDVSVHFIPQVDDDEEFGTPPLQEIGSIIEQALSSLTPARVHPAAGATLDLDREQKKEELQRLTTALRQRSEQNAILVQNMSEQWQQEFQRVQSLMQAQADAVVQDVARRRERQRHGAVILISLGPLSVSMHVGGANTEHLAGGFTNHAAHYPTANAAQESEMVCRGLHGVSAAD